MGRILVSLFLLARVAVIPFADASAQIGRCAFSGSDQLISGGIPLSRATAHAVFLCTN
jgi:hypothetical protein